MALRQARVARSYAVELRARVAASRLSFARRSRSMRRVDQRDALVHVIDDFEQHAGDVVARGGEQRAADGEIERRTRGGGHQCVGGLLDAVVLERELRGRGVDAVLGFSQQVFAHGRRQQLRGALRRALRHARERGELEAIADGGAERHHALRVAGSRRPIFCAMRSATFSVIASATNGVEVVAGSVCAASSKLSRPSACSFCRNWRMKNGLPPVFSRMVSASGAAVSPSMRSESPMNCVMSAQPSGADLRRSATGTARRSSSLMREHERMRGHDFVVAAGRDQQQRMRAGGRQQRRQQAQARRIRPLHVVEEYDQRTVLAAEHLQEVLEDVVEAVLRFGRFERRERRLRADDAFQRRHHFGDRPGRCARRRRRIASRHARVCALALGEQLADQVVQRGDDGAERHVALQLVELAGDEVAELLAEPGAHLLDQRGLADAGRAREHDRAPRHPAAARRNAIDNA